MIKVGITTNLREEKAGGIYQSVDHKYIEALKELDVLPVLLPPVNEYELIQELLSVVSGIVISGGERLPPEITNEAYIQSLPPAAQYRLECDIELCRQSLANDIPLLGICYGMQLINVCLHGTLHDDVHKDNGNAGIHNSEKQVSHEVMVRRDTKLWHILGTDRITVNSSHWQSVREAGNGLRVSAEAPGGIVEAIEHVNKEFTVGVQWHPERLHTSDSRKLFEAFIKSCGKKQAASP